MNYSNLKCNHELFKWASKGRWSESPETVQSPFVFVFERLRLKTPTQSQIEDFRRRSEVVKAHGGIMGQMEHEIAGVNPVLSDADCADIIYAMTRDFPAATIVSTWNGAGCYTMSVGIDLGKRTDEKK